MATGRSNPVITGSKSMPEAALKTPEKAKTIIKKNNTTEISFFDRKLFEKFLAQYMKDIPPT
jgi:hypothetical protein